MVTNRSYPSKILPGEDLVPISLSNELLAQGPCRALFIGNAGNLNITTLSGNDRDDVPVQAGIFPVQCIKVRPGASGIAASNIWAVQFDQGELNLAFYNFYFDPPEMLDKVSEQALPLANYNGSHWGYNGEEYGPDEYAMSIGDKRILTHGAYTVLNSYSNDISNAYWTKLYDATAEATMLEGPVGDVGKFITGDASYSSLLRNSNLTFPGLTAYTLSAYFKKGNHRYVGLRIESAVSIDSFNFYDFDTDIIDNTLVPLAPISRELLSDGWVRLSQTFTTGAVPINLFDIALTDDAGFTGNANTGGQFVYIDTINVTETSYVMPPVVNNAAGTITIPNTYSDADEGPKLQIVPDPVEGPFTGPGGTRNMGMPQVIDAFDGVADGGEGFTNGDCGSIVGWDVDNDSTIVSTGGEIEFTSTTTSNRLRQIIPVLPETLYEFRWKTRVGTIPTPKYSVYNFTNPGDIIASTAYSPGENSIRFTTPAGCVSAAVYVIRDSGIGTIYLDNASFKQVSPAQGELEAQWMPMFNYEVPPVSTSINILSLRNEIEDLMFFRRSSGGDNYLYSNDDNSSTYVGVIPWQAGTLYITKIIWGPHPDYSNALKMQVIVTDGTTTWDSTVFDFDGSFNPIDWFLLGFENSYSQEIGKMTILKEPVSWG